MMRFCGVLLVVSFVFAAPARADLPGAQKYLDQAKKQVADKDPSDRVETTLKLAEAELDGVGATEKEPLVKEIASLRTQMKSAAADAFKKNTVRELDRMLKVAQETLGSRQAGINNQFVEIEKILNDPKTTEALGATAVDDYRKQLATFKKVSDDKMRENDLAEATRQVEYLEKEFPELLKDLTTGAPASQEGAATKFYRNLEQYRGIVKELPANQPGLMELTARMEKMRVQVDAAYGQKMVAEVLDRLKRNWEIGIEEITGWETETTPAKFADLVKASNEANSKLGAPKTAKAAARARQFLESVNQNEQAKPYVQTSPLKEFVESIAKMKTDGEARLVTFASAILTEAEGTPLNADSSNRLKSFVNDDLRLALEGNPQLIALQARGNALVAKFEAGVTAASSTQSAAMEEAKKDAAARWPEIVKNVDAVENFDPGKADSFVGKTIRLKSPTNRLGYDYGVDGGFDFAMDVNGKPLAAKYSPEVRKAIADMNAKTGTIGLPEETPYDVIAVYDGTQGTLMRRVQYDEKGRIENTNIDVRVQGEKKEPVDAPVLTIVGLYCGPVAVYSPSAAAAASGGGFFTRLVFFGIFLLAGLTVLVKARFAPIASLPNLGGMQTNLTPRNLMIIGFAFLALGVYELVRGYVYYGLIGNLALMVAGIYLALDFLERQTWWKPDWSAKLRLTAVPIGITCVVVGILRLVGGAAFL